jgi:hypothetical protein
MSEELEPTGTEGPAGDEVVETVPYTSEEMAKFTPTSEIDMERVPEPFRPVIENMTRDYKELQTDHTRKSQRLAELERTPVPPEPETYFAEDPKKDSVFKDYLKAPGRVLSDINGEIARLESILPDDGLEEYRTARRSIAYWNGVKDEFSSKRMEVSEARRERELAESKLATELGADAPTLIGYAKELGWTEHDFRTNPRVRDAVKRTYAIDNAAKLAEGKEKKPIPQKTAKPSGESGSGGRSEVDEEIDLSVSERIARAEKRSGMR